MGRINNLQLYPIDPTISLDDFFLGSDADNNLQTVNFSMRDLVQFVGDNFQNVAFIYGVVDDLLPESGEIYLNSGELTFETVTEIRINRRTSAGIDLLNLYQLIRDHNDSIFIRLQTTDPDIAIGYYRIDNVVQLDDDFIFTLTTYQSFFRGDYSIGQNMEVVFVHQNQITFSDILSTPTTIGGYGITDSIRTATLDPSTFVLSLSDTVSNVVTSVSLAALNTGGVTIQYNSVTEMIELVDSGGTVISSFPVADLLTNVGSDIAYNATNPYTLELRDSANAVLGSVNLTTSNIQDLSNYTGFDSRFYQQTVVDNFFLGTTPIAGYNKSNWDAAHSWGNHTLSGYLTAIPSNFLVETDPRVDLYQGMFNGDLNTLNTVRGTWRTTGSNMNQPAFGSGFISVEVEGIIGTQMFHGTDGVLHYRSFAGNFLQWRQIAYTSDIPTSLPADGGNADTLDNENGEFYLDHNNLSNIPNFQLNEEKGQPFGYPTLDGNGLVPLSQLPQSALGGLQFQGEWDAATNTPPIPASAEANRGHYYIVNVAGNTEIDGINVWGIGDIIASNGVAWFKVDNTDSVTSVQGRIGAVVISASDVGLGNVNNTSDLAKPISTLTQTALNARLGLTATAANSNLLNGQNAAFYLNYNNFTNVPLPVDLSLYAQLNTNVTFGRVNFGNNSDIFIDSTTGLLDITVRDTLFANHGGNNEQELRLTDGNSADLLGMVLRTSTNNGVDWENTFRATRDELTYRGRNVITDGFGTGGALQTIFTRLQVGTSMAVDGSVNVQLELRENNPNGSGIPTRSILAQINNTMFYLSQGDHVFGGTFTNRDVAGLRVRHGGSERDILHTNYSGNITGSMVFDNGMTINGNLLVNGSGVITAGLAGLPSQNLTQTVNTNLRVGRDFSIRGQGRAGVNFNLLNSDFSFMMGGSIYQLPDVLSYASPAKHLFIGADSGVDVVAFRVQANGAERDILHTDYSGDYTGALRIRDSQGLRFTNGFTSGISQTYPSQLVKVQNVGNDGSTGDYSTMLFHSCERISAADGRLRVRMSNRFVGGAGLDIRNIGNNDHELYFLSSNGVSIPNNNSVVELNQYRVVHEKNLEALVIPRTTLQYLSNNGIGGTTSQLEGISNFSNTTGSTGFPSQFGYSWFFSGNSRGRGFGLHTRNSVRGLYYQPVISSGGSKGAWELITTSSNILRSEVEFAMVSTDTGITLAPDYQDYNFICLTIMVNGALSTGVISIAVLGLVTATTDINVGDAIVRFNSATRVLSTTTTGATINEATLTL